MTEEAANGEEPADADADADGDDDVHESITGEGIFCDVVGHKGAKAIVRGALRAGDVHVMLVGPPASGKSAMLMAIEDNVPGTIYRDGQRFTATRVQSAFKEDPPILLIDEIDALGSDAYEILSAPLEHGRLTEDTHDQQYDIEVGTQVIAACNSTARIPDHIQSRFREVHFEGYSEAEIDGVAERMLPKEVEWVQTREEARKVSAVVREATGSTDPRDVRDVAKLATSVTEIESMAVAINDADADVDSDPIMPDEVERAKTHVGRSRLAEKVENETHGTANGTDPDDIEDDIDQHVREEIMRRELQKNGE